jgi:hypothetical protein
LRSSLGSPAAARPITTALSPARTRSIMITWRKADKASLVSSSSSVHLLERMDHA